MASESGQRFDPNVLRVFIDLLPEMVEISQQFADSMDSVVNLRHKTS